MQTLLQKVEAVEAEGAALISRTEEQGRAELHDMLAREERFVTETRDRALARAVEIVKEQTDQAEQEINAIRQEAARSVESIHETSASRRPEAVARAYQLFLAEYMDTPV